MCVCRMYEENVIVGQTVLSGVQGYRAGTVSVGLWTAGLVTHLVGF